jgi:hypothetical protein
MPLERHWDRVHTPVRETAGRERNSLAAVIATLAVVSVIAVFFAIRAEAPKSAASCVDVVGASTMGAANYHACGQAASDFCSSAAARAGARAAQVATACRHAGFQIAAGS